MAGNSSVASKRSTHEDSAHAAVWSFFLYFLPLGRRRIVISGLFSISRWHAREQQLDAQRNMLMAVQQRGKKCRVSAHRHWMPPSGGRRRSKRNVSSLARHGSLLLTRSHLFAALDILLHLDGAARYCQMVYASSLSVLVGRRALTNIANSQKADGICIFVKRLALLPL